MRTYKDTFRLMKRATVPVNMSLVGPVSGNYNQALDDYFRGMAMNQALKPQIPQIQNNTSLF